MKHKSNDNQNNTYTSVGLDIGAAPIIEMLGNKRVTIEGSMGILQYESENIKINTNKMVLSFCGRGLCVRCISNTCVVVEGFVNKIDFIT